MLAIPLPVSPQQADPPAWSVEPQQQPEVSSAGALELPQQQVGTCFSSFFCQN